MCIANEPRAYPTQSLRNNCLLLITLESGQKVAQDLCIYGCMILMPKAFLSNRWASRLVQFHGHIVAHSQMSYHIVIGCIRCIAPINLVRKFWSIPCPMDTPFRATTSKIKKQKQKPNVRPNILDEGYPLHNEGITYIDKIL